MLLIIIKKNYLIIFILFLIFSAQIIYSKVLFEIDDDVENSDELEAAIDLSPTQAANLLEKLDEEEEPESLKIDDVLKNIKLQNPISFDIGEEIVFSVKYGIINVGNAVFRVSRAATNFYKRPALMITSDAQTNSFFDAVYRVRDRIVSYVDTEKLISYKYIKVQREGGKKINELIRYKYPNKIAVRYRSKLKKDKINHNKTTFELKEAIFDPFAALYYLRTLNFKVGDTVKIPVSSSTDQYELNIKILKLEKLNTKIGKIDCYKLRPVLLKEGIFLHKGDMDIWVTADNRKIPVKMQGQMLFGSITATIERYRDKQ